MPVPKNLRNYEDQWNPLDGPATKRDTLGHKIIRLIFDIFSVMNLLVWYLCVEQAISVIVGKFTVIRPLTKVAYTSHHYLIHLIACSLGPYVLFPCGLLLYLSNNLFGRPTSMKTKNHFHGILMFFGFFWIVVGNFAVGPLVEKRSAVFEWKSHVYPGYVAYYLTIASLLSGLLIVLISQLSHVNALLRIFIKFVHDVVGIVAQAYIFYLFKGTEFWFFEIGIYFVMCLSIRVLYLSYLMYTLIFEK